MFPRVKYVWKIGEQSNTISGVGPPADLNPLYKSARGKVFQDYVLDGEIHNKMQ